MTFPRRASTREDFKNTVARGERGGEAPARPHRALVGGSPVPELSSPQRRRRGLPSGRRRSAWCPRRGCAQDLRRPPEPQDPEKSRASLSPAPVAADRNWVMVKDMKAN